LVSSSEIDLKTDRRFSTGSDSKIKSLQVPAFDALPPRLGEVSESSFRAAAKRFFSKLSPALLTSVLFFSVSTPHLIPPALGVSVVKFGE